MYIFTLLFENSKINVNKKIKLNIRQSNSNIRKYSPAFSEQTNAHRTH